MIMVGLNMYPHNTSVASRNEQWQRVNRLIRPIRLNPRLVELVERLYGREVAAALRQCAHPAPAPPALAPAPR